VKFQQVWGIVDKIDGWMDDATLTTFLKHSQKFCKKLSKTNKQTNKQGVCHTLAIYIKKYLKAKEE
jgi:hypothetical protein